MKWLLNRAGGDTFRWQCRHVHCATVSSMCIDMSGNLLPFALQWYNILWSCQNWSTQHYRLEQLRRRKKWFMISHLHVSQLLSHRYDEWKWIFNNLVRWDISNFLQYLATLFLTAYSGDYHNFLFVCFITRWIKNFRLYLV